MLIWMAVSADKLELPLAVADTAAELGRMLGTSKNSVILKRRRNYGGKYRIVAVDDGESRQAKKADRRDYYRRYYLRHVAGKESHG